VRWLVAITVLPVVVYGSLNLITPHTTRRWQVRATSRHREGDLRRRVGETFQQLFRDDPDGPPDAAVLRRIQILGIAEIALGLAIGVVWLALL